MAMEVEVEALRVVAWKLRLEQPNVCVSSEIIG